MLDWLKRATDKVDPRRPSAARSDAFSRASAVGAATYIEVEPWQRKLIFSVLCLGMFIA